MLPAFSTGQLAACVFISEELPLVFKLSNPVFQKLLLIIRQNPEIKRMFIIPSLLVMRIFILPVHAALCWGFFRQLRLKLFKIG